MSVTLASRLEDDARSRLRVAIAIPARNEEQHIAACLHALGQTVRCAAGVVECAGVVLLLNNCTDATTARAKACARTAPYPLTIVDVALPPARAHAGVARRLACDHARALLDGAGALLVTDADSRVAPDWLLAQARAFRDGADVVAGRVKTDRTDMAAWPRELRRRELREAGYSDLLCEMAARIDPDPDAPWPHHDHASGASLGATLDAYRRIGGFPERAVGEDRAFVAAAKRMGLLVRHDAAVRVVTSGRMLGRAAGGKADTISYRVNEETAACDERLEPAQDARRRFAWRRRLRLLHARKDLGRGRFATWSDRLILPATEMAALGTRPDFAAFWQELEERSPALVRAPVQPRDLIREIVQARAALRRLRTITASAATHPLDSRAAVPNGWSERSG